ncbi:HAD-like protein [Rhodocollybia butyracea]|uniref:HAD-like protein n=1 Tax=Rhodocollybia butyracea TaxID=206335 RepID=A0A9P5PR40_9AGAR|nr:HAD-like protein [Rhodocollybia butyracea]
MTFSPIRLVTFDILHTLITPRWPIHVQYAMAFEPHLGVRLDPNAIKSSFKTALKSVQKEKPAYAQGSHGWWTDVIERTALGAGANPEILDASLENIAASLMKRFSSREGYQDFSDAIPTIDALHQRGIYTAVISNSDARSRLVLKDLEFPDSMVPIVLSEQEGIEKPTPEIFLRTLERVSTLRGERITAGQTIHVGDELDADYRGAEKAGMTALLLRRPGAEGDGNEDLQGVKVIQGLDQVLHYAEY